MSTSTSPIKRYILLPTQGIRTETGTSPVNAANFLKSLQPGKTLSLAPTLADPDGEITTKIIDSIDGNGARLVELSPEALVQMRAAHPGLRIVPEVFYYPQRFRLRVESQLKLAAQATGIRVQVVASKGSVAVEGAMVVAFTNFTKRQGAQGTTNAQGEVILNVPGQSIKLERLYIYPKEGFWSFLKKSFTLKSNQVFKLKSLNLAYQDAKRHFYGDAALPEGQGITVGVIDTGAGPHPDLVISGGQNTVTGEDPGDFSDSDEHGTHVSGIIAGRGTAPNGVRGLAPGVALRVYRVFGKDAGGASNFAIIKAIDQAVADGCDLLNMSLGGGDPDEATQEAISHAYQNGTIAFVATGNDGRQPVSFPASFSLSQAVGAMGRKGTFPAGTTDTDNVAAPYGTDKKNFVASFSNIGQEVDLIAPGVGIVSSVPGGYAPMSGTSMACPAATGRAARLLASQGAILAMPRDQNRSAAILTYLATQVTPLGVGAIYEGKGML